MLRTEKAVCPIGANLIAPMSEHRYDPRTIEPKWQAIWDREGTWQVSNEDVEGKPKYYVLEMLPYPSGEPHMGHLKNYAVGDAVAHFRRRNGYRVLHPMGYDAFGLPAENHAIKTGEHPRDSTAKSIEQFQTQLRRLGFSIDWSREFATCDPRYYRWTQWLFLRFLERGLAYRKEAAVNWCPKDATVLANEQVIDGRCERCGTPVFSRSVSPRSSGVSRRERLTYSCTASSYSVPAARRKTSGCSGAMTKNVAPNSVSGRVVKIWYSVPSSSHANVTSAPCERPIQLRCIVTTWWGQSIVSRSSSSRSAYSVMRKNHCSS